MKLRASEGMRINRGCVSDSFKANEDMLERPAVTSNGAEFQAKIFQGGEKTLSSEFIAGIREPEYLAAIVKLAGFWPRLGFTTLKLNMYAPADRSWNVLRTKNPVPGPLQEALNITMSPAMD